MNLILPYFCCWCWLPLCIFVLYSKLMWTSLMFAENSGSMGQRCSRYFGSTDVFHMESDTVKGSQMEKRECDTTCNNSTLTKNDIASCKQDSQSKTCSDSAKPEDNSCNANSTTSSMPTAVAVTSSQRNAEQHQPWFFAHMTEEHWERLNMMCIVSPSSL